jgi:hypothetical protein
VLEHIARPVAIEASATPTATKIERGGIIIVVPLHFP